MSQLPPEETPIVLEDFVKFAKFRLSSEKRVLLKDPIWEQYSDEEILIEYFALLFEKDKNEREKFAAPFRAKGKPHEDFADWADRMIGESEKKMIEAAKTTEDSISFSPDTIGG